MDSRRTKGESGLHLKNDIVGAQAWEWGSLISSGGKYTLRSDTQRQHIITAGTLY